jgi:type VI secretion system protein ImpF
MSGRSTGSPRTGAVRIQAPLLDRLIDENPDQTRDPPISAAESLANLRNSVRRDLEALLNSRRRWRSWPGHLTELATSPIGYGVPDFAAGAFNDPRQREELRIEVEETIRRFEPRFISISVKLVNADAMLESTMHLRIDAVLHAEPAPEPIAFDTRVDPVNDEVVVRMNDAV